MPKPVTIRQFHNADLPALVELWTQHWSAIGPPPLINAARFEQAVLARTFFDPADLLVAERDGAIQAWCHHAANGALENTATICAICLGTGCDEEVSSELLDAVQRRVADAGFQQLTVGLIRDDTQGYGGVDPIGHGIGIPKSDTRMTALLDRGGFAPGKNACRLVATTRAYRPPVSRDALQLRRSSQIRAETHKQNEPRLAASMSHLDIESNVLCDRAGNELASVQLWFSDPEAEVMNPSLAILDIANAHARGRLEPAESYLIGTLAQSMAQRRIQTIETSVDSDHSELLSQLQTLHFQVVEEGIRWVKSLA